MSDNYPSLLIKAVESKLQRDKLLRNLAMVNAEIEAENERLEGARANLDKEAADIVALQKMSLTNLILTILGNKAERLEKEQAELMEAQIKYQTTFHLLEIMQAEKQGVENDLTRLGGADKALGKLLSTRPKGANDKLTRLAEAIGESHSKLAEIDEALTAGNEALHRFDLALAFLNDAKKLGVFDLVGGGILASAAKHSSLNEAQKYAEEAQIYLQRFNRELYDVHESAIPSIQLSDQARFADLFFDGLITDLYTQNKINESLAEIVNAQSAAHKKIELLHSLRQREANDLEKVESEWQMLTNQKGDEQK